MWLPQSLKTHLVVSLNGGIPIYTPISCIPNYGDPQKGTSIFGKLSFVHPVSVLFSSITLNVKI